MKVFAVFLFLMCTLCSASELSVGLIGEALYKLVQMEVYDEAGPFDEEPKELSKSMEEIVDGLNIIVPAVLNIAHYTVKEENELKHKLVNEILPDEDKALEEIGTLVIQRSENFQKLIEHAMNYSEKIGFVSNVKSAVMKVVIEATVNGLHDNKILQEFFEKQVETADDGKCDGPYVRMGVATAISGHRFVTNAGKLVGKIVADYAALWKIEDKQERAKMLALKIFADVRRGMKVVGKLNFDKDEQGGKEGKEEGEENDDEEEDEEEEVEEDVARKNEYVVDRTLQDSAIFEDSKRPRPSGRPRPCGKPRPSRKPRPGLDERSVIKDNKGHRPTGVSSKIKDLENKVEGFVEKVLGKPHPTRKYFWE